jgi:hypothetical protein
MTAPKGRQEPLMKSRTGLVQVIAGASLAIVFAAPAEAAPPAPSSGSTAAGSSGVDQANCVYDEMSDANVLTMVDTYLQQDATGKPEVEKAIAAAYKTCAAKYGWKTDRSDLAGEIALQGAVIDVVMQDMADTGLKDDGAVVRIWDKLSEEDVDRLLEDGWEKDAALTARLRQALIDGGVPDKGDMLKNGVIVLVAASREAAAMDRWLHGDKL